MRKPDWPAKITTSYLHVPHNEICFPHKSLHKRCFQFLKWRLLVPREVGNNA